MISISKLRTALRRTRGRRTVLMTGRFADTRCAGCGRGFGPAEYAADHGRDGFVCTGGCVVECVEHLQGVFQAKVPDALLYYLGVDDDPDPVWLAIQRTATVTVWGDTQNAVAYKVPLSYARAVIAKAKELGLPGDLSDEAGPDYAAVWDTLGDHASESDIDAATKFADKAAFDFLGTGDFAQLDEGGRRFWYRTACGSTAAWKAASAIRSGEALVNTQVNSVANVPDVIRPNGHASQETVEL